MASTDKKTIFVIGICLFGISHPTDDTFAVASYAHEPDTHSTLDAKNCRLLISERNTVSLGSGTLRSVAKLPGNVQHIDRGDHPPSGHHATQAAGAARLP